MTGRKGMTLPNNVLYWFELDKDVQIPIVFLQPQHMCPNLCILIWRITLLCYGAVAISVDLLTNIVVETQ